VGDAALFIAGRKLLAFAIILAMLLGVGMLINSVLHRNGITGAACVKLEACLVYEPLSHLRWRSQFPMAVAGSAR
jgi:hypothetical protein